MRFIVLTSSEIGSATVVNYIQKTTPARIGRVYFDMRYGTTPPEGKGLTPMTRPELSHSRRILYHLRLAAKMPRHYAFKILERVTGIDELEFLCCCERLHPALLWLAAGIAQPQRMRVRPVLHRLHDLCRREGIPIVSTPNLNDPDTIAAIRSDQPDVLIGLGTRILSRSLLRVPRIGTLNAHSSLLPEYRGATTEFWQLVNLESMTGITIHWMLPRVDEGEICGQASWPIPHGANHHHLRTLSLFRRLELWRDVVMRILQGDIPRQPQGPARTPTFHHPSLRQQYAFYCLHQKPPFETP